LYDMILTTLLFLVLYALSRRERRLGILTLAFGAWYGASRVLEDFLRVDKRFFGMTGSQWTGLTVSIVCLVTLLVWAVGARKTGPHRRAEQRPDRATQPDEAPT
jgi:prolipoprotein diacylglyceryltransferase